MFYMLNTALFKAKASFSDLFQMDALALIIFMLI